MAVLGLGLAALGRPAYMTVGHAGDMASTSIDAMAKHAAAMCQLAYVNGIRHFDVARSYGRGEQFLREWLEKRQPTGVTVSSKWGYRYTGNWVTGPEHHEVKDHSLAHLDAQWPESKAVLGDWLTVFQIHSATLESGVLEDAAVLDRLAWLKQKGLQLGLTVTGPRQPEVIRKALTVMRDGGPLFGWVQATWNVLEQSAGPVLEVAHAAGLKVIVKEPLANGRLTVRGDTSFNSIATAQGVTPDALALSCALAQPWADIVLLGAATAEQLASNLKARETPAIDVKRFAMTPETYWAERAKLAWT
jgi:aryl-alcohol dehydrogenase-like predicted oxidoreductase